MEICLGDFPFVTISLNLDSICAFAACINEMLDRIEMVFRRLKEFNLKIQPKECHFFRHSLVFLGHVLLADTISTNPEKVNKVKKMAGAN